MTAQLILAESHPTHRGDLLLLGAAFVAVGSSTFLFPQLYDASTRFRHRLWRRKSDEERAVKRYRILRQIVAASFIVGGAVMVLAGLGAF